MVRPAGVRIDAVVLENSLQGGNLDLVQEFLWTVHSDPGLADAVDLAPNGLYLHVSLVGSILLASLPQEISDVFAIDFQS